MNGQPPLSQGTTAWLSDHLASIEAKIIDEARKLITNGATEQMAVAEAARRYAPGDQFPENRDPKPTPFWSRIAESISGITLVTAVLAIIFGVLGLLDIHGDKESAQRWIDVAKIFAGAVVGSAGVSAVSSAKGK
jgi:hypothetical protein